MRRKAYVFRRYRPGDDFYDVGETRSLSPEDALENVRTWVLHMYGTTDDRIEIWDPKRGVMVASTQRTT